MLGCGCFVVDWKPFSSELKFLCNKQNVQIMFSSRYMGKIVCVSWNPTTHNLRRWNYNHRDSLMYWWIFLLFFSSKLVCTKYWEFILLPFCFLLSCFSFHMCKPYLDHTPSVSSASFLLTWHATLWFYMPQCFLRDTGLLPFYLLMQMQKWIRVCVSRSVVQVKGKKDDFMLATKKYRRGTSCALAQFTVHTSSTRHTNLCTCVCVHLMHEKPNQRWGCKTEAKRQRTNENVTEKNPTN